MMSESVGRTLEEEHFLSGAFAVGVSQFDPLVSVFSVRFGMQPRDVGRSRDRKSRGASQFLV